MLPAGIPINRYARKFIIFPIIPKVFEPAYSFLQIVPNGAARLVTKGNHRKNEEHGNNCDKITVLFFFCVMVLNN